MPPPDDQQASSSEPSPTKSRITASVAGATLGDQASRTDRFGFKPYVEALAEFLLNKDTQPPLSVSVEGEWGSGKSSFMLQLQDKLEAAEGRTVWFSPWRHDSEDSLWAAFALHVTGELARKQEWWRRPLSWPRLFFRRMRWREAWWDLARLSGGFVALILGFGVLVVLWLKGTLDAGRVLSGDWEAALTVAIKSGGALGLVAGCFGFMRLFLTILRNPFQRDLSKHLSTPDYAERVAFVDRFQDDFRKILNVYLGKLPKKRKGKKARRVFIFIDDLDRCNVPKAAELIEAINLLISEDPRLVFILGMDREKVAAGIAVKYERSLKYLKHRDSSESEDSAAQRRKGVEFGYAFVEKFIQVPFQLPEPTNYDIDDFLKSLREEQGKKTEEAKGKKDTSKPKRDWNSMKLDVAADSKNVHDIVKMVAGALDSNPRRLIQFINLFRLRAYIANKTGLFNPKIADDQTAVNSLTLQQLGKFVAISLRWPTIMSDVEADLELFKKLEEDGGKDASKRDPLLNQWSSRKSLMGLIRYKAEDPDDSQYDTYSMAQLDVKGLLAVSPEVDRPPERPEAVERETTVKGGAELEFETPGTQPPGGGLGSSSSFEWVAPSGVLPTKGGAPELAGDGSGGSHHVNTQTEGFKDRKSSDSSELESDVASEQSVEDSGKADESVDVKREPPQTEDRDQVE